MNEHIVDIVKVQTAAIGGLIGSQSMDLFFVINDVVQVIGTTLIIILTVLYTSYKFSLIKREHKDDTEARNNEH
jgi:hypothetical protein